MEETGYGIGRVCGPRPAGFRIDHSLGITVIGRDDCHPTLALHSLQQPTKTPVYRFNARPGRFKDAGAVSGEAIEAL